MVRIKKYYSMKLKSLVLTNNCKIRQIEIQENNGKKKKKLINSRCLRFYFFFGAKILSKREKGKGPSLSLIQLPSHIQSQRSRLLPLQLNFLPLTLSFSFTKKQNGCPSSKAHPTMPHNPSFNPPHPIHQPLLVQSLQNRLIPPQCQEEEPMA